MGRGAAEVKRTSAGRSRVVRDAAANLWRRPCPLTRQAERVLPSRPDACRFSEEVECFRRSTRKHQVIQLPIPALKLDRNAVDVVVALGIELPPVPVAN